MPPHREAAQGPHAIEWLLTQFSEHGYQDLRLETVRVDYAGDIAVEVGRYTVAIHQPDGTTVADRGKFVHAWRRLGAWLLVADSWSSNLPGTSS
jgi:ketosteroid isomerase-like protein